MTNENVVCVERVDDLFSYKCVRESLERILDPLCERIKILKGAEIVIKVNLCLLKGPETGATVDPTVAKAVVEYLNDRYEPRRIFIAESDATHLSADMAFKILGWEDYFADYQNVKLLNLSKDEVVTVAGAGNLGFSKTMMSADALVSLAKLKTHTLQKISCVMKNQFGAISEKFKIKYHPLLTKVICQAVKARQPDLCLVDGLIAMEGNGPTNGVPKRTKILIGGNDAYSVDHLCATLMGFKPSRVPHLAAWKKGCHRSTKYGVQSSSGFESGMKFKFLPLWKSMIKESIEMLRKGKGDSEINEEA